MYPGLKERKETSEQELGAKKPGSETIDRKGGGVGREPSTAEARRREPGVPCPPLGDIRRGRGPLRSDF